MRRVGWGLFLLVVGIVLGSCRVDATVEARVTGAGGTVTARFRLDREAVAVLGGAVADGAQTSDLEEAGWEIEPLRTVDGGGAEVEVSKEFHRPSDLGVVIAELAGPDGPLRDFRLERSRSFTKARYRVAGSADLGAGAEKATGYANTPDLTARLRDAGVDPGRVEELLVRRAAEGFHLRLVVELPGRAAQEFEVRPGAPVTVDVASDRSDYGRPVLLAIALVSGLFALLRLRRRTPQS